MIKEIAGVSVVGTNTERLQELLAATGLMGWTELAIPDKAVVDGLRQYLSAVAGQKVLADSDPTQLPIDPADSVGAEHQFAPVDIDHPDVAQIITFYDDEYMHEQAIPDIYRSRLAEHFEGYLACIAELPEENRPPVLSVVILRIFLQGLSQKSGGAGYANYSQVAQIYEGAPTDRSKPPFAEAFVNAFRDYGKYLLVPNTAPATEPEVKPPANSSGGLPSSRPPITGLGGASLLRYVQVPSDESSRTESSCPTDALPDSTGSQEVGSSGVGAGAQLCCENTSGPTISAGAANSDAPASACGLPDPHEAPITPDSPPASIGPISDINEPAGSPPPDQASPGSLVDESGGGASLRSPSLVNPGKWRGAALLLRRHAATAALPPDIRSHMDRLADGKLVTEDWHTLPHFKTLVRMLTAVANGEALDRVIHAPNLAPKVGDH